MPISYLLLIIIWEWWAESDINGSNKIDLLGLKGRRTQSPSLQLTVHWLTPISRRFTLNRAKTKTAICPHNLFIFSKMNQKREFLLLKKNIQKMFLRWFGKWMSIIVYIINKLIITLKRMNYVALIIIQTQHTVSEDYFICITIVNQREQH